MPEMVSAAEAPIIATMSGSFSRSCDSTVATTWVSLRKPSTKSGRIGRSIRREVSVSFSVGRPSRLKKPPGILPAAKVLVVHGQREEVDARAGRRIGDRGAQHHGVAIARQHRAIGLAGDAAGLERELAPSPHNLFTG